MGEVDCGGVRECVCLFSISLVRVLPLSPFTIHSFSDIYENPYDLEAIV